MYEEAIEQLNNGINILNLMRDEINALPAFEKIDNIGTSFGKTLIIGMAYDTEALKRNQAKIEAAGWERIGQDYQSPESGALLIDYIRPGSMIKVQFHLRPEYAGSTCKLNLIGYQQKPIYEVTCMDADPLIEAS